MRNLITEAEIKRKRIAALRKGVKLEIEIKLDDNDQLTVRSPRLEKGQWNLADGRKVKIADSLADSIGDAVIRIASVEMNCRLGLFQHDVKQGKLKVVPQKEIQRKDESDEDWVNRMFDL